MDKIDLHNIHRRMVDFVRSYNEFNDLFCQLTFSIICIKAFCIGTCETSRKRLLKSAIAVLSVITIS